jgi:hypothetical protein
MKYINSALISNFNRHFNVLPLERAAFVLRELGSSVIIVSDYGLDDRAIVVRSRQRQRIFPLTSVSRPALRPNQPPVQWVPGLKRGRGVTLTTHPHLVPRSIISRSYTSSPPSSSMACSGTALLYFCTRVVETCPSCYRY